MFFTGCSLGCCYCQNYAISQQGLGKAIDAARLEQIFLELQAKGAKNLNLVTATQWLPWVTAALDAARARGLCLPVVWNTGGYETRQTVAALADQKKQLQGQKKELAAQIGAIAGSLCDVRDIEGKAKVKGVLEKRIELPQQDFGTLCEMAKASGKLLAENRSLRAQLQYSEARADTLRQRLTRCEAQLAALQEETAPYREAMRTAPQQVQEFLLGIQRRRQAEQQPGVPQPQFGGPVHRIMKGHAGQSAQAAGNQSNGAPFAERQQISAFLF